MINDDVFPDGDEPDSKLLDSLKSDEGDLAPDADKVEMALEVFRKSFRPLHDKKNLGDPIPGTETIRMNAQEWQELNDLIVDQAVIDRSEEHTSELQSH